MTSKTSSADGRESSCTIWPSARNTTRSAYDAARGSWVTMTTVCLNSSVAARRIDSTSPEERESRLPVGSSPKMIDGLPISARAQATRCC